MPGFRIWYAVAFQPCASTRQRASSIRSGSIARPCTGSLRGATRNGEPGEYRSPDMPLPRQQSGTLRPERCPAGVPMAATATRPELLLHADFVRGLARALVGADGEDVAQQAWVRALQAAPPRGDARAF